MEFTRKHFFLNFSVSVLAKKIKKGARPAAGENFDIWHDFGLPGHDLAVGFG